MDPENNKYAANDNPYSGDENAAWKKLSETIRRIQATANDDCARQYTLFQQAQAKAGGKAF